LSGLLDLPIGIAHAWILVSGLHKIAQRSKIGEIYPAVFKPFVYEGGILGSITQTWASPNSNSIRTKNNPLPMRNPAQLSRSFDSQSTDTEEFTIGTDQEDIFMQDVEPQIMQYLYETPCDELDILSCFKSLGMEILEEQVPTILELWSQALRKGLDTSTQAARTERLGKLLKHFNEGIDRSRLERNIFKKRRELVTSDRESLSEKLTEAMFENDDMEDDTESFQCVEAIDRRESENLTEEKRIHAEILSDIKRERSVEELPKPIRKYSASKGPFTTGWNPGYFGWKPSKTAEPSAILHNLQTRRVSKPEFGLAESQSESSPVELKIDIPLQSEVGTQQFPDIKPIKISGKKVRR